MSTFLIFFFIITFSCSPVNVSNSADYVTICEEVSSLYLIALLSSSVEVVQEGSKTSVQTSCWKT